MNFPGYVSFTITNVCNLQCSMCGQWSEHGYMRQRDNYRKEMMPLSDWKRVVDELEAHNIRSIFMRGGEPFLYPRIIPLLEYIRARNIFVSIDTNGTMLEKYAEKILDIGNIHMTFSVDGPEPVHDAVRRTKGCFERIRKGLARLHKLEEKTGKTISTAITFTISGENYESLSNMPDVARELGINTITIVPYYYVPGHIGEQYEKELMEHFNCAAFSWRGFCHETSGIDADRFIRQFRIYKENLGTIYGFPYLELTEDEYRVWFENPVQPIKSIACTNIEKLIDIQPNGDVNFCVDFPDYSFGNASDASIEELWNCEKAEAFRRLRRQAPFSVCHRCGAKYMSEIVIS